MHSQTRWLIQYFVSSTPIYLVGYATNRDFFFRWFGWILCCPLPNMYFIKAHLFCSKSKVRTMRFCKFHSIYKWICQKRAAVRINKHGWFARATKRHSQHGIRTWSIWIADVCRMGELVVLVATRIHSTPILQIEWFFFLYAWLYRFSRSACNMFCSSFKQISLQSLQIDSWFLNKCELNSPWNVTTIS